MLSNFKTESSRMECIRAESQNKRTTKVGGNMKQ